MDDLDKRTAQYFKNLNELDIDLDELKEFALENDHHEIYDWAVSSTN